MTTTRELLGLAYRLRSAGATVLIEWDEAAQREGHNLVAAVTVNGAHVTGEAVASTLTAELAKVAK